MQKLQELLTEYAPLLQGAGAISGVIALALQYRLLTVAAKIFAAYAKTTPTKVDDAIAVVLVDEAAKIEKAKGKQK